MKILLLGCNGQVGWELQRSLSLLGELVALERTSESICGDLSRIGEIAQTIERVKPDVVVNAAAYTSVDQAENDAEKAYLINAFSVEVIAKVAEKINALLVHYSTDYVFDGTGEHFHVEDEMTGPLNVYGHTKLAGEKAIEHYCSRYLILRTSWVYAPRGKNFPKLIYRLALEKEKLSIINDQFGAPTSAEFIADSTAIAIRKARKNPSLYGTYHLVANGVTTWFDYAKFILALMKKNDKKIRTVEVEGIPSSSYSCLACRPLNSRLNNKKFKKTFDIVIPEWHLGVERMMNELLECNNSREKL